jgi:hypothetical protein
VTATDAVGGGADDDSDDDGNVGLCGVAGDLVADAGGPELDSAAGGGVPCCDALVSAAVSTARRMRHIAPDAVARRHRRLNEKKMHNPPNAAATITSRNERALTPPVAIWAPICRIPRTPAETMPIRAA